MVTTDGKYFDNILISQPKRSVKNLKSLKIKITSFLEQCA